MKNIAIPVVLEPGSQPADADGVALDYMKLPGDVWTYSAPLVPEPDQVGDVDAAIALAQRVQSAMAAFRVGDPPLRFELDDLDHNNLAFIDQLLQSGEVSVRYEGRTKAQIQESVLAGLWRLRYIDEQGQTQREFLEIGGMPGLVVDDTFVDASDLLPPSAQDIPANVGNAAALLTEIADKQPGYQRTDPPHVINLSLMPNTDEDMQWLIESLGSGPVVILSRGYGNCRITSTGIRNVWWVQYFNSQDTLILNTIELSTVPEVACAAQEDIDDSAQRLNEILELYR